MSGHYGTERESLCGLIWTRSGHFDISGHLIASSLTGVVVAIKGGSGFD